MSALKVLMVASEAAPLAKVGGLADVLGVLPRELNAIGVDCRVIMPLYKRIKEQYGSRMEFVRWSMQKMGWRSMYSGLLRMQLEGVTYYFIDNEFYFNHDDIYLDYSFDIERFAFFQRAVLECLGDSMGFEPDIIHCHDWQAGMIPVLLEAHYHPSGYHRDVKTVFTIHNLKYQGIHGVERIADLCDLGSQYMNEYGILKDGVPNFMKAGIVYSDAVTTVSPTYANEILNDFYGEGLDWVLRNYQYKLSGILNGIDEREYDPQTDPYIAQQYSYRNYREAKAELKQRLREELNLTCPAEWPMIGMITRLVDQKGLDLLIHVLDEMLDDNVQMVILGTGEARYEKILREFAARRSDRFAACITFDNPLAHRIYAASDLFMMPSIFEPCGLSQMIAMRYGTLPVVRETGGLSDTVEPYNQYTGQGTGFSFRNINAHECLFVTKDAVDLYNNNPEAWDAMVRRGMEGDYSWDKAARRYVDVYSKVLGRAIPVSAKPTRDEQRRAEKEQGVQAEAPAPEFKSACPVSGSAAKPESGSVELTAELPANPCSVSPPEALKAVGAPPAAVLKEISKDRVTSAPSTAPATEPGVEAAPRKKTRAKAASTDPQSDSNSEAAPRKTRGIKKASTGTKAAGSTATKTTTKAKAKSSAADTKPKARRTSKVTAADKPAGKSGKPTRKSTSKKTTSKTE